MKNLLMKLFQNRFIRVDYREDKVLGRYNDFFFSKITVEDKFSIAKRGE